MIKQSVLSKKETPCETWKEVYSDPNKKPSAYIIQKRNDAIERIITYSKFLRDQPFYVTDSFGKDSCVVYDIMKFADVPYDVHHNITTCDPTPLIQFGLSTHTLTIIHKPKTSMCKLIERKGVPPTRMAPYCCDHLKERGGAGRFVITGLRREESRTRKTRQLFEPCYNDTAKRYLHPIVDWTENDVWEYIHAFKVSYCSLYDEGMTRIGCCMCPKSSLKHKLWELKRFPLKARSYLRSFRRALLIPHPTHKIQFQSEYDMLSWWIFGKFLRDLSNKNAIIIMNVGEL